MNATVHSMLSNLGTSARKAIGPPADDHIARLERLLTASGYAGDMKAIQLFGAQLASLVIFPAVWIYIFVNLPWFSFMFEGPKQVIFYLALMAVGFLFPTFSFRDRIKARQASIALELPDMADLLTISVEAGLDFMTALHRVVSKQRPGPLRDEMERLFRQMELGRTRREGLRELADRIQLSDMSNMCSALIQADRLGSSIAPVLRVQSDMLRTRRMQRAEKNAMEAPIKMMAPLLMCIFPAVFVVMFAPIFIQMFIDLTR